MYYEGWGQDSRDARQILSDSNYRRKTTTGKFLKLSPSVWADTAVHGSMMFTTESGQIAYRADNATVKLHAGPDSSRRIVPRYVFRLRDVVQRGQAQN